MATRAITGPVCPAPSTAIRGNRSGHHPPPVMNVHPRHEQAQEDDVPGAAGGEGQVLQRPDNNRLVEHLRT